MEVQGQVEYEPGKIFVGGLSWETKEEGMKAYFEQFGIVTDCVVMRDPTQPPDLKRNRGFGFVKFEDPSTVDKVMSWPTHTLDNKTIDPKRAQLKGGTPGPIGGNHVKKVFLGGLNSNTTEQDIRNYFAATYQVNVTDVDFKMDKSTNRMRGFCFVGFDSTAIRDMIVETRYHEINGKRVEAKKAEPRGAAVTPQMGGTVMGAYGYQQTYQGTTNGQYANPYYGSGAQSYYPYPTAPQAGYGQQQYGSAPTGYTYDHTSAYPRTQTSAGDRQDSQAQYHQYNPYGHSGGQMGGQMGAGYGQDTTTYPGRTAYGGAQDAGYGQHMAGYNRATTQQQQPRFQTGAGSYGH